MLVRVESFGRIDEIKEEQCPERIPAQRQILGQREPGVGIAHSYQRRLRTQMLDQMPLEPMLPTFTPQALGSRPQIIDQNSEHWVIKLADFTRRISSAAFGQILHCADETVQRTVFRPGSIIDAVIESERPQIPAHQNLGSVRGGSPAQRHPQFEQRSGAQSMRASAANQAVSLRPSESMRAQLIAVGAWWRTGERKPDLGNDQWCRR